MTTHPLIRYLGRLCRGRFLVLVAAILGGALSQGAAQDNSSESFTFGAASRPGWQMISAPFTYVQTFSELGMPYVYAYEANIGDYIHSPTPPADTFRLGQGYWTYLTRDVSTPAAGSPVDSTKPLSIPLQAGWNQVGNPFLVPVLLSQMSVSLVTGSGGGSFDQTGRSSVGRDVISASVPDAVAHQLTSPLYLFDPVAYHYVSLSAPIDNLNPWAGAWIWSRAPGTLLIQAPAPAKPASTLIVSGFPSPTGIGAPVRFTVTARDASGNTATSYRGTIHFTSSDPAATLPADYTFATWEWGIHTFTATLRTVGIQSITAADIAIPSVTGSQTGIVVKNGVPLAQTTWPKFHGNNQNTGRGIGQGAVGMNKWSFAQHDEFFSPVIGADGTVYVGSWRYPDYNLNALDGATGAQKWVFRIGPSNWAAPAIGADGTVYIGAGDGNFYALDGATGTKKWAFAMVRGTDCSAAIGTDGTIYVGDGDGNVYALDGVTGAKKWSFKTGGTIGSSSPAIGADGTIYIGSWDGNLYALDGATGTKKWAFDAASTIESSPAIGADGTIYFGSLRGSVYAVDGATGGKKWAFDTGNPVYSSPAIGVDGTVYFADYWNNVYALDGATGVKKWGINTGGEYTESSPAIAGDGTIYIGCGDGNLYALDGTTGAKKWAFRAGRHIDASSPAIGADGTLYVGSDEGFVAIQ